jgi:hypothetical protein
LRSWTGGGGTPSSKLSVLSQESRLAYQERRSAMERWWWPLAVVRLHTTISIFGVSSLEIFALNTGKVSH